VIHNHAIGIVTRRLHGLGMIPPTRIMPVAQARGLRAGLKRVRFHGAHAANQ
jgi:hypothetical protein